MRAHAAARRGSRAARLSPTRTVDGETVEEVARVEVDVIVVIVAGGAGQRGARGVDHDEVDRVRKH